MKYALVLLALVGTVACVHPPKSEAAYTPPLLASDSEAWVRTVDRPFDEVWTALVDHISGTFFSIENFEKESGLLTLSFGAKQIGQFVDGGHWVYDRTGGVAPDMKPYPEIHFDGNYADYLEQHFSAELQGSMNLFISVVDSETTRVKVRARYVVSVRELVRMQVVTTTWIFDSGGWDETAVTNPSAGTPITRTMRPTHVAERSILDAIEAIIQE
jgi:hypothetical protein